MNEFFVNQTYIPSHYYFVDGFVFKSIDEPANIFDAIVIRNPNNADCVAPKVGFSQKTLEEHIEYINNNNIEKALVIAEDISFLSQCPTLKYLQIIPAKTAKVGFDYSPLYTVKNFDFLACDTVYGPLQEVKQTTIDYSNFDTVKELRITGKGQLNSNKIKSIKSLNACQNQSKNIKEYFNGETLEKITLLQCKIETLVGIENAVNLKEIVLSNNRSLYDISNVVLLKNLKSLVIENCSKITDFSFLGNLTNLEYLELLGNNDLPNLRFLNNMKKLKTFNFSMNVVDGDLSNCLNIPYVYCIKGKKHYNLKNKDLPKRCTK